jgi:hypothetical protein
MRRDEGAECRDATVGKDLNRVALTSPFRTDAGGAPFSGEREAARGDEEDDEQKSRPPGTATRDDRPDRRRRDAAGDCQRPGANGEQRDGERDTCGDDPSSGVGCEDAVDRKSPCGDAEGTCTLSSARWERLRIDES